MHQKETIDTSRLPSRVAIGLSIAGALYLLLGALGDLDAVWGAIKTFPSGSWALILILSLGNYGFRAVRWHFFLSDLQQSVPAMKGAIAYLTGFALTLTPGKVGEMVRCVHLRRLGVDYAKSTSACFVERVSDLLAILLLSIPALLIDQRYLVPAIGLLVVITIVIAALSRESFHQWAVDFLDRSKNRFLKRIASFANDNLATARILFQPRSLSYGLALGVIGWALEGVGLYIILQAFSQNLQLLWVLGIFGISMIVGALSLLPGGLGSTELTMIGLLSLSGVSIETATAATMIFRIATLWLAIIIGILSNLLLSQFTNRHATGTY